MRVTRSAIAALAIAGVLNSIAPAIAAPDGTTTTLEIGEGVSAIYYATQGINANVRSKGARAEAESYILKDDKISATWVFANVVNRKPVIYSLRDMRGLIVSTIAKSASVFGSSSATLACTDTDKSGCKRLAFENLRACWNNYVIGSALDSSSKPDKAAAAAPAAADKSAKAADSSSVDCVALVEKLGSPFPKADGSASGPMLPALGIDYQDTAAAFAGAPALAAEVTSQQVGGIDIENRARAIVIATLASVFIDQTNPACRFSKSTVTFACIRPVDRTKVNDLVPRGPFAAADASASTDWLSSAGDVISNCVVGDKLSITGCIPKLSSIQTALSAGVAKADMCALGRGYWMPTFSRIIQHSGDADPSTSDYGAVPGC